MNQIFIFFLYFCLVTDPHLITIGASRIIANETQDVFLPCTHHSNPYGAYWFKDDESLTIIKGKHEEVALNNPSLIIRNINREDAGNYTCWLENQSEESIYLDVHYPPDVKVIIEPSTPVPLKTVDAVNITIQCNVTSGNPSALLEVRWFHNGEVISEIPDCEALNGHFCTLNPALLSIIEVEEEFAGNYSCQGANEAGYGRKSRPQELRVYYPPSCLQLKYHTTTVLEQRRVTLECITDHADPDHVRYVWYRGAFKVYNITTPNWTIQASLNIRYNFTCSAIHKEGTSCSVSAFIDVWAPPAFIARLPPYRGFLYSSKNISLTCRIECFPLCSVIWFKDGTVLDTPLYYVSNTVFPADPRRNDVERIKSTLVWNMTNWPDQQLDKNAPLSSYTCMSRSVQDVGPEVKSTVFVGVEFPPENLTVSRDVITVVENQVPEDMRCSAKGWPSVAYTWKKKDSTSSSELRRGDTLRLGKVTRSAAGDYICEAINRHGRQTAEVELNVLYKPECSIEFGEQNGNQTLICSAKANPRPDFEWRVRQSDATIDPDNIFNEGFDSYLILDSSVDENRTYVCIANNTVGVSVPCEKDVNVLIL